MSVQKDSRQIPAVASIKPVQKHGLAHVAGNRDNLREINKSENKWSIVEELRPEDLLLSMPQESTQQQLTMQLKRQRKVFDKRRIRVTEILRRSSTDSSGPANVQFGSEQDDIKAHVSASPNLADFSPSLLNPEALLPIRRHQVKYEDNDLSSDNEYQLNSLPKISQRETAALKSLESEDNNNSCSDSDQQEKGAKNQQNAAEETTPGRDSPTHCGETQEKQAASSSEWREETIKLDETHFGTIAETSSAAIRLVRHWPQRQPAETEASSNISPNSSNKVSPVDTKKLTLSRSRQTCQICEKQMRNAATLLIHYQQHQFMDNLIKNADTMFGPQFNNKRAKKV